MVVFSLSLSHRRDHIMVIINFLPIWFRLCLFSYNELMRITRSPLSAYTQNSPSKHQNGFHHTRDATDVARKRLFFISPKINRSIYIFLLHLQFFISPSTSIFFFSLDNTFFLYFPRQGCFFHRQFIYSL